MVINFPYKLHNAINLSQGNTISPIVIDYEESDEDGATLYDVGTNLSALGTD